MTITPQQLIALLPLLIVGLTVVVVMLGIAWRRDHFINATLTVIGLNLALLSLYFVGQAGPMDVTPLLRVDGYSMFYTGLVLLASLATCTFAYPWLVGYPDNREEFYLLVLIAADLVLALSDHWGGVLFGVALWGVHMGMTQGLLAAMVAHTAPAHLRGTAFGMFNLISGVALLLASLGAGTLWELFGSASTFYAGALICVVTLVGMQLAPFGERRP